MLQEFLAALYGFTGDIFKEDENGDIKVVGDLPFVSPPEQSLLNETCTLGTYYRRMCLFVNKFSNPLINREVSGLYKLTFAHAVNEALEEYRIKLVDIQRDLLRDPCLSINFVKCELQKFFVLFPIMWNIINVISLKNLMGCQILDGIYKNVPYWHSDVRDVLNEMIKRCNHVFYRQLSPWLLRGVLFDPYKEFFIEGFSDEEVDTSSKGMGIIQKRGEPVFIDNMTKSQVALLFAEKQRTQRFKINESMIPCFLPGSLIKKVLFIGESVHFFDHHNKKFGGMISDSLNESRGDEENQLKKELFQKFSEPLEQLRELSEFNLLKVQSIVEDVEKFMLRRMWDLLIIDNKFLEICFSEIKDFYLLGRGELFLVFLSNVERQLIGKTISNSTESALNSEFLKSFRLVGLDNEEMVKRFKFTVRNNPDIDYLRWEDVDLSYDVKWPFHIVLTPAVLSEYNDLFRFFVLINRTHMRLKDCFCLKKCHDVSRSRQWHNLHFHMTFLINNLQYYIQVDVIESRIALFTRQVLENQDIEVLKSAHENLVNSLKGQSFLFYRHINNGLVNICEVCVEYCKLIELHTSMDQSMSSDIHIRLEKVRSRFQNLSTMLYNILSNVEGHYTASPYLRQLLLRLDFNSFFSMLGSEIGSLMKASSTTTIKYKV